MLDYRDLRKCIKFYINRKENVINLILDVCEQLGIPVYTNKEYSNIFIEKEYSDEYTNYFLILTLLTTKLNY